MPDAKRPKRPETENARLKKLVPETLAEAQVSREALRQKWWPCQSGVSWYGLLRGAST